MTDEGCDSDNPSACIPMRTVADRDGTPRSIFGSDLEAVPPAPRGDVRGEFRPIIED